MSECKIYHEDENGNLVCVAIENHEPRHDKFNTTWTKNWTQDKERTHHYDLPENVRKAFKL